MRIPAAVFVALLLLTSPVGAAASSSTTGSYAVDDTSAGATDGPTPAIAALSSSSEPVSWITLDGQSTTSGVDETTPNLGSVLGMEDRALRSELAQEGYENRFEAATTAAERQAVLDDALADTELRFDRLVQRERASIERHAAGELSTEQFLRELAGISREASDIERTLLTIDELSKRTADAEVSTRDLGYAVSRFDTPIRNDIVAATTGSGDVETTVHVESNGGSAVLSSIDGDQYLREGIRTDEYDPDGTDQFSSREEVLEVASSHYPWLYSLPLSDRDTSSHTYGTTTRETINSHPAGSSRIFLDSNTEGVFLEHHTLDLSALPRTATVKPPAGNVSVSANRIPNGGPVWVKVTDSDGEPINASVDVDGTYVTTTGDDGLAWLLAPHGDVPITVSAGGDGVDVRPAENVTVTVREPSN